MQKQTDEQKEDKQKKEEAQNEEAEKKDEEGEFLHYEGTLSWEYIFNHCWH
jgi:hypothetical protein